MVAEAPKGKREQEKTESCMCASKDRTNQGDRRRQIDIRTCISAEACQNHPCRRSPTPATRTELLGIRIKPSRWPKTPVCSFVFALLLFPVSLALSSSPASTRNAAHIELCPIFSSISAFSVVSQCPMRVRRLRRNQN